MPQKSPFSSSYRLFYVLGEFQRLHNKTTPAKCPGHVVDAQFEAAVVGQLALVPIRAQLPYVRLSWLARVKPVVVVG